MADPIFPGADPSLPTEVSPIQYLSTGMSDANPSFPPVDLVNIPALMPAALAPAGDVRNFSSGDAISDSNHASLPSNAVTHQYAPISQLMRQTELVASTFENPPSLPINLESQLLDQDTGGLYATPLPGPSLADAFGTGAQYMGLPNSRLPVPVAANGAVSSTPVSCLQVQSSTPAAVNSHPGGVRQPLVLRLPYQGQTSTGPLKGQIVRTADQQLMFVTEVSGKRVGYVLQQQPPGVKGVPASTAPSGATSNHRPASSSQPLPSVLRSVLSPAATQHPLGVDQALLSPQQLRQSSRPFSPVHLLHSSHIHPVIPSCTAPSVSLQQTISAVEASTYVRPEASQADTVTKALRFSLASAQPPLSARSSPFLSNMDGMISSGKPALPQVLANHSDISPTSKLPFLSDTSDALSFEKVSKREIAKELFQNAVNGSLYVCPMVGGVNPPDKLHDIIDLTECDKDNAQSTVVAQTRQDLEGSGDLERASPDQQEPCMQEASDGEGQEIEFSEFDVITEPELSRTELRTSPPIQIDMRKVEKIRKGISAKALQASNTDEEEDSMPLSSVKASGKPGGSSYREEDDEEPLSVVQAKVKRSRGRGRRAGSQDSRPLSEIAASMKDDLRGKLKKAALKKGKSKKKKWADEPTRPPPPYQWYFKEVLASVRKSHPKTPYSDISKIIAQMWDKLSKDRKADYQEKFAEAKAEYLQAMAEFRERHQADDADEETVQDLKEEETLDDDSSFPSESTTPPRLIPGLPASLEAGSSGQSSRTPSPLLMAEYDPRRVGRRGGHGGRGKGHAGTRRRRGKLDIASPTESSSSSVSGQDSADFNSSTGSIPLEDLPMEVQGSGGREQAFDPSFVTQDEACIEFVPDEASHVEAETGVSRRSSRASKEVSTRKSRKLLVSEAKRAAAAAAAKKAKNLKNSDDSDVSLPSSSHSEDDSDEDMPLLPKKKPLKLTLKVTPEKNSTTRTIEIKNPNKGDRGDRSVPKETDNSSLSDLDLLMKDRKELDKKPSRSPRGGASPMSMEVDVAAVRTGSVETLSPAVASSPSHDKDENAGKLKPFKIPKKTPTTNQGADGVPATKNNSSSVRKCVRSACENQAKISKERGAQYCSNECVVLYCRDQFNAWVLSRQNEGDGADVT